MPCARASQHSEVPGSELQSIVEDLLRKQNLRTVDQCEIDRYIIPYILALNQDPILKSVSLSDLIAPRNCTFNVQHLPDIGIYVRCMLIDYRVENVTYDLLRYSMPYIKHNRLCFPEQKDVTWDTLVGLLRIQLATCIGLFYDQSKKPVWSIRVQLVALFMKVICAGSPMVAYIFCASHLALLRISMVEYYMYFVQTNMPVESQLQYRLFGTDSNTNHIFRQMRNIIDAFRQGMFQCDVLDWSLMNARAQSTMEKCNRTCKSTTRVAAHTDTPMADISPHIMRTALSTPKFAHSSYALMSHLIDPVSNGCKAWSLMAKIQEVHSLIEIYSLPFNIVTQQCRRLEHQITTDTAPLCNACFMYVCVKCKNSLPDKHLRFGPNSRIFCNTCLDDSFMLQINMIGRLVKVQNKYFYLCPYCVRIHAWTSVGYELSSCVKSAQEAVTQKGCTICTRTNSISRHLVLDSQIGVMQPVLLCSRHTPYSTEMKFVHDLGSLIRAIQSKYKKMPPP